MGRNAVVVLVAVTGHSSVVCICLGLLHLPVLLLFLATVDDGAKPHSYADQQHLKIPPPLQSSPRKRWFLQKPIDPTDGSRIVQRIVAGSQKCAKLLLQVIPTLYHTIDSLI